MQASLRPLSLGEILDRTIQLYRSRFLLFVGISGLAASLHLVWALIQTVAVRMMQTHAGAGVVMTRPIMLANGTFGLVSLVVYVVVAAVAIAAISRAVSAVYLDQPTGIAQAYSQVKPHWMRYVLVYLAAFMMSWGLTVLAFAGITIVSAFMARLAGGGVILIGILALSLLLVVPFGVWMMCRYSLANAASVFEDLGVRGALRRSVRLTQGSRGRIFVMFLLAGVLIMVLSYASMVPLLIDVFRHRGQQPSLLATMFTLVSSFLITTFTTPFYAIALTLFYYDGRIRQEGFDVFWMLERAGGRDVANPPLSGPPELLTPYASPVAEAWPPANTPPAQDAWASANDAPANESWAPANQAPAADAWPPASSISAPGYDQALHAAAETAATPDGEGPTAASADETNVG